MESTDTLCWRSGLMSETGGLAARNAGRRGPGLSGRPSVETYLQVFVDAARAELRHWGYSDSVVAMLSLIGGKQVSTALGQTFGGMDRHTFDRDVIAVPDVEVSGDSDTHAELRPMYDVLWQSAGCEGSPNFDVDGSWRLPRA